MCVSALPASMHVPGTSEALKRSLGPLELKLQMAMNHHVE